MADTSPLAGLLDRAGEAFQLAGQLGRAFEDEHKRRSSSVLRQQAHWGQFEPDYNRYAETVLSLSEPMQNPPTGFESVAKELIEAANVARQIRDSLKTRDGLAFSTFLEFWPDLTSISQGGYRAIQQARETHRPIDPFAFLDKPNEKPNGINSTPTMPEPPDALVQAAARDIPAILANVPKLYDGTIGMETAAHLVTKLQQAQHTLAAAQWAIHESVQAGRLQTGRVEAVFPGVHNSSEQRFGWGRGTKAIPKGKPTPFDSFKVVATDELWTWWRSAGENQKVEPVPAAASKESKQGVRRTLRELADALSQYERALQDKNSAVRSTSGKPVHPLTELQGQAYQSASLAVFRHEIETREGFQELRTFTLREWREELTATVCRRLIGEILRRFPKMSAPEVDALTLRDAAERLNSLPLVPAIAKSNESKARRGGRPKHTESKDEKVQARLNLYKLIGAVKDKNPTWGKKELHSHFKADKDFVHRAKEADLKLDFKFFHAALVWIADHASGQETRSENVS